MRKLCCICLIILISTFLFGACSNSVHSNSVQSVTSTDSLERVSLYGMEIPIGKYDEIKEEDRSTTIYISTDEAKMLQINKPISANENHQNSSDKNYSNYLLFYLMNLEKYNDDMEILQNEQISIENISGNYVSYNFKNNNSQVFGQSAEFVKNEEYYLITYWTDYNNDTDTRELETDYFKNLIENIKFTD